MDYIRGSEWKRWDLHLHTPFTKKNDQYDGIGDAKWEQFYSSVSNYVGDGTDPQKAICAVGITDYLSIDNYFKVKNDKKFPDCIKFIFPNIEVRVIPVSNKHPVNAHFIFSPSIDSKIESHFLSKLEFRYGSSPYYATKDSLIDLGRALDSSSILDDEAAYKKGIEQFVLEWSTIYDVINNDPLLKENCIIGICNGSRDGVSGIITHPGYQIEVGTQLDGVRYNLYQSADIIFSGNPNDVNYFLGLGSDSEDEIINKYGSLKPCVIGCDAHSNDQVFSSQLSRFCWIKAEPTFEGLKQIIYEPNDRVRITDVQPEQKKDYYVIDRVVIENNNLFDSSPIYFNDKLTCIIGGKSTGKSLLLHNMALAIDPQQVNKKLEVAQTNVRPLEMKVFWRDGACNSEEQNKIIYIPQSYLDRLSDETEETTEIDAIIQSIILQDTAANEAFKQKELVISASKKELLKSITDYIQIHESINSFLLEKKELGNEKGISEEIKKLEKELHTLSQNSKIFDREIIDLQEASEKLQRLSHELKILQSEKRYFETLNSVVNPIILDDSITLLRDQAQEIINLVHQKADEEWVISRKGFIKNIDSRISSVTTEIGECKRIIGVIQPKLMEHKHISILTDSILEENKKLSELKEIDEILMRYSAKSEELLERIAKSFDIFREIYSKYVSIVNQNDLIGSSDLVFKVETVVRTKEF